MYKLSIFDDGAKIATITLIDDVSFLFARTPREWWEMKRLMDAAGSGAGLLERIAALAHNYNYSTEITQ